MAITIGGSLVAPAIPATAGPSKARPDGHTCQITGLPAGDLTGFVLYTGSKATGTPATYADLTSPRRDPGSITDGYDYLQLLFIGGLYQVSLRTSGGDYGMFTVGDRLFVCLFDVDPPVPSTPVLASHLLGLVVA